MAKKTLRLLLICMVLAFCATGCTKEGFVANKISVAGIDVGGMSREEAINALDREILGDDEEVLINVEGETITFKASDVGAVFNTEKTVDYVMEKSGGFFSGLVKKEFPMQVDIDKEKLEEVLLKNETLPTPTSGRVVAEGLEITNAVKGKKLDGEKVLEALTEQFGVQNRESIELEYIITEPEKADYRSFLEGFLGDFKKPEYIRGEDGSVTVTESSPKVSFDMKEAERLMKEHTGDGEVFVVPGIVEVPEHTKAELEEMLFRDTLASYTTSFATSSANRSSNIALATKTISETVLLPGEEFSFNNALGKRTVERGYKTAGAYVAGKTVDQVGGGICQVSSTLYNTVLLSNLEIVERRSHQMTVSYVPMGRDATVNWGTTDFRFKNNTDYPVKLVGTINGKKVTISAVGTLDDPNRKIEIATNTVSVLPPGEVIVEDAEKEVGFTQTEKGSNGYIVDATRIVYSGDEVILRESLTRSKYNPTNSVTTVGTKVVEAPTAAPSADEEMPIWLLPPGEDVTDEGI